MGCPPTKVNTQTTHSCPPRKHASTLTNTLTHTHTDDTPVAKPPDPHLPAGIDICQSFRFLGKWIFHLLFNGRWPVFQLFDFPYHTPPPLRPPNYTLLIHSSSRHTDCSQHLLRTCKPSFSVKVRRFWRRPVVDSRPVSNRTACHSTVPGDHSQSWTWDI